MIKEFKPKDFIFNNGIVNLYNFLLEEDFDISLSLNNFSLIIEIDKNKADNIYFEILKSFFKKYKIVHQTKNDRWYFDENRKDFILDKKFDTLGGQKNDLRNGIYLYKNIKELGLSREYVENLYLNFCQKYNQKIEKESNGQLKVPNKKNEVIIAITLEEAIERFTKYFVNNDILKMDSKIHTFEDGQSSFQDMVKLSKNYKIDKWNALVYWFGGRAQRLYNFNYFIYPNSSDMKSLYEFKNFLKISDENTQFKNEKGELKTISTNINFYETLKKDNILNKNFYISKSEEEFEVKFFMYLTSLIYHIEEQYDRANIRRKAHKEIIYQALQHINFVIYTDDGTFKTSLNEYTKAYRLIRFFETVIEEKLFDYLADIIVTFSMSQGSKEVNFNLQNWCKKILNFLNLRKEYYLTSFNILKNNSKSFGKKLFEFEKLYIKNFLGVGNMNIHEKSKKLGDGIGHYCAELGDKDLLFKLRSIKNYKQLIGYFKDLKFSILKNEEKAKFSKDFNEALDEILGDIEANWEIIRDYIAIYAIDKFRAVNYAKSNN